MLTKLLTQKICTKNERFTTFTILRQISVNAFEMQYFYAHCLFLTPFFINHLRGTAKKIKWVYWKESILRLSLAGFEISIVCQQWGDARSGTWLEFLMRAKEWEDRGHFLLLELCYWWYYWWYYLDWWASRSGKTQGTLSFIGVVWMKLLLMVPEELSSEVRG